MFIKTFIFNSNKSIFQIIRKLLRLYLNPIRGIIMKRLHCFIIIVIDNRRRTHYENTILITEGEPELLTPLGGDV